ncbi:MAG: transposase, partial [Methylococcales bacterium]|nr:transposase [Methylococcales bacterium]
EIEKAYQIANEANFTEGELELQHKKRDWISIQKSALALASKSGLQQGLKEGLEQGLEQGLEKGRQAEKKQMVINMHKVGVDITQISQASGFDIETIKAILS